MESRLLCFLRLFAAEVLSRRREHELADESRMPNRNLQRDTRTIAESEQVGLPDLQMPRQCRDVVGRRFNVTGASRSVVRPCPCSSTAITLRFSAKTGSTLLKVTSIVEPPPCNNTRGTPSARPCTS